MKPTVTSQRMRQFLTERTLSAAQLALGAGYSSSYVRNLIAGKIKKPGDKLLAYCEARYSLNPDWLLGLSDEMYLEGGPRNNYAVSRIALNYLKLPPEQQQAVALFIRALTLLNEQQPPPKV